MRRERAILRVSAGPLSVYEVAVRAPADEYEKTNRLPAAVQAVVALIDKAVQPVYGASVVAANGDSE